MHFWFLNLKRRAELLLSLLAFRGAVYYVAEKAQVWGQMDLMLNPGYV